MDEGSDTDENMPTENDDENDSDYEAPSEKLTLKAKKIRRSNGKWKLYRDKNAKKEWQELYPWVEEDPKDPKFVKCGACNKKLKASKSIFETHQKTKKHLKNLSGSDDIEDEEDENNKKSDHNRSSFVLPAPPQFPPPQTMQTAQMDQMLTDDQISFFAESPVDAAHQAITGLIDKLVEKYHENRLDNLKMQNEAMLQLNVERANLIRAENQRKLERRLQQEQYMQETQEVHLKHLQQQHDMRINALEDERDARLKAVEQELMLARQEYEKKMRLLDCQLSIMK